MLYIETWKRNLIFIVMILSVLYAAPNMLPAPTVVWMQEHLPSFLPTQTVNLGLDLRGGSHLLLQVETDAILKEKMQSTMDDVRSAFRKEKIGYTAIEIKDGAVHVKLGDTAQSDRAKQIAHDMDRELELSIKDGDLMLRMSESMVKERKLAAMGQSIEIVRRRIDETGTREPSIQRQGDDRILVQLPGVDDPGRIKKLLGQTAKLTFRLVDEGASQDPTARVPADMERLPATEREGGSYVVQKRVMVSGDKLVDAQPSFQNGGEPVVSFKFDARGGKQFGEATRTYVGRLFAIVLDGKVISAPVIREPITGGSGQISGSFTVQSAQDLALLLRAGALPAPIKVLEERTVGPGLGADSIKAGAYAALIGLGLVVIGVLVCYGSVFGMIANVALLFNIAMIFAVLSVLQATLTLPGIAGLVLTIGMAVDANVLIFERVREEIRLGRTALVALDTGYKRALPSIFDANITTLIAAFLLFIFGSGPIKGFAVTLSIGIITSIFSAVMISHLFVVLWSQKAKPKVVPI